jgi:peptidoglycan hydrolase-like protein with peptidoglycan-binding domain
MSQRFILSEEEKKSILNQHSAFKNTINEQSDDTDFIKSVQTFLNEKMKSGLTIDGRTGLHSKTSDAISAYQTSIGLVPADGVWGKETWAKMPPQDSKRLKEIMYDQASLLGKAATKISDMFN